LRPRWARQKFRLYCGKRRALQEFVNNLRGDEIPLIAYGAATFASGGRGERSVPVKGIQRLVRQTYPTVLVDEYNTTKMCPTCHVPLQHVKVRIRQRDESWRTVTCHDLRRCGNRGPGGCALLGCSWKNRDEAASLNIGRCARLKAVKAGHDVANRPASLRRRAQGEPKHPDKTVFRCRPVDAESGAPKKIGRQA
jgi:integrase